MTSPWDHLFKIWIRRPEGGQVQLNLPVSKTVRLSHKPKSNWIYIKHYGPLEKVLSDGLCWLFDKQDITFLYSWRQHLVILTHFSHVPRMGQSGTMIWERNSHVTLTIVVRFVYPPIIAVVMNNRVVCSKLIFWEGNSELIDQMINRFIFLSMQMHDIFSRLHRCEE